ncbi:MAG TPA: hypothetical protein ENI80_01890 [Acidiferrobacteraceae bacterium]|nr:hypothetical protein [Acidiferrobacteraceae bacterium]
MHKIKIFFSILSLGILSSNIVIADQGITNPVHGKHVGEIVWSKKPIDFRSPNESSFQKTFNAGDAIYGRVYQKNAINNYQSYNNGSSSAIRDGGYEIRAIIDGKPIASSFGVFYDGNLSGKAASEWTTWRFSPYPENPEQGFEQDIANKWTKAVRGLTAGNHKIRFEAWGTQGQYKTKQPIAAGEFTLVLAAGDKISSTTKFPEDSYSGSDKDSLKQKMKRALVGPVAKNVSELTKMAIASEWKQGVYKKQIPRLEYRKITGIALWRDTNNDQLCRFVSYNFIQDKMASGWSPLRFHGFCNGCNEGEVDCQSK